MLEINNNNRELLFSLTKKDFKVEFYRDQGKGGQNKNKRDTACRITHTASGAVATASEQRSQLQNKRKAFERLVETSEFKQWHKLEVARLLSNDKPLEQKVEESLSDENLLVEYGPF